MREEDQQPDAGQPAVETKDESRALQSRRGLLKIATLGTAAVVTIRPGMAQGAVASAMTCSITIPLAADAGKNVKKDGSVVKSGTANSWAFPSQPLKGEDVKNAIKYNSNFSGTTADQTDGYLAYINNKITSGKPGFTCYASLQSPNRF